MRLGVPQIILVVLYLLALGIAIEKHGEEREGKYNFFASLLTCLLEVVLLYWGGFFG